MPKESEAWCARPTGGPVGEEVQQMTEESKPVREERSMVMVGQKSLDFVAPGS